jgi:hypothetical protein
MVRVKILVWVLHLLSPSGFTKRYNDEGNKYTQYKHGDSMGYVESSSDSLPTYEAFSLANFMQLYPVLCPKRASKIIVGNTTTLSG